MFVHTRACGYQAILPVDGDEGQVRFALAQVVQRVRELDAVGDQEVDVL